MKPSLFSACKELFLYQFPITAISEILFFFGYLKIKKPQLVDIAWEVNHFLIGLMLATENLSHLSGLTEFYNQVYLGILLLWTLRLGGFLFFTRIMSPHVDPRYVMLSKDHKHKNLYFFFQYVSQGFMSTITAFSLYYLFQKKNKSFAINDYIGIILALIGIVGEHIADQQLYNHKHHSTEDQKKVFRGGLWRKSRHPNLFFDLVMWLGIAVSSLDLSNLSGTMWTFIGPVALWAGMNFVTIPITVEHMKKSKSDFEQVEKETNKFIPI